MNQHTKVRLGHADMSIKKGCPPLATGALATRSSAQASPEVELQDFKDSFMSHGLSIPDHTCVATKLMVSLLNNEYFKFLGVANRGSKQL